MIARKMFAVFGILALCLVFSCQERPSSQTDRQATVDTAQKKDYLSLIIALDTLPFAENRKAVRREDSLLRLTADTANPFYYYFRGRRYGQEKKQDSAVAEFQKMAGKGGGPELAVLRNFSILDYSIPAGVMVESELVQRVLDGMKAAEQQNSRLTYRYYDLMARAYYQNHTNIDASLDYAERSLKHHPYKAHPVVRQRHYDISFLLAGDVEDYDKMMLYNNEARILARQTGDSQAIARTYDNESRIFVKRGEFDKALACSRVFIDYLKRTNNVNAIAYNNLASTFVRNKMLDSAIFYYREALSIVRKSNTGLGNPVYYLGLIEAYKKNKDYRMAIQVADSAYGMEIKNLKEIEAVKIADLREKYETEKKDRDIAELSGRNAFNEKIIRQQRWTLVLASIVFVGVLAFFYFLHRQYRLNEKNRLLQSENRRLQMEQKLLQVQLNPHFIFNSIANLQSLVATGDTKESVRYLSAFSGLLRNVLEQSRRDFISLGEEIVSLENYLQLQQMRFAGLFDYEVTADEGLYPEGVLIPPMLVQPFVENSIEHGFRNIDYRGMLSVRFKVDNGRMFITIADNGRGLTAKTGDAPKKQSLAGTILRERLDVLFNSRGQEADYTIENKKETGGQGVTVHIVIPEIND